MSTQSRFGGMVFPVLALLATILACSVSSSPSTGAPAFDPTKAALELQATAMSLQLTKSSFEAQQAPTQPPLIQPTLPPQPTPTNPSSNGVQPTEPPIAEAQAFFTEEFDNGSDDWSYFLTNGDDSDIDLYAKNGMFTFDITGRDVWVYALYDPYFYENVRVDISAANRGDNYNNISLICRYDEKKGWYEFNVYSDGRYDILFGQWKPGQTGAGYETLYDGGSNAIHTGMTVNEYTMICKGITLSLYINGTKVRTVNSEFGLQKGQVGIGVSSFDRYPVAVDYEWVKISEP